MRPNIQRCSTYKQQGKTCLQSMIKIYETSQILRVLLDKQIMQTAYYL